MKIDPGSLSKFAEIVPWLGENTQKSNFLKVLEVYEKIASQNTQSVSESPPLSEKLIGAAEGYVGKSYDELNCYELVVETLEKTGMDYSSESGMKNYLASMAQNQNLPVNNYMTGEGIVEAFGNVTFSKTIDSIENVQKQADSIVNDMKPHLNKGGVLSFSMQTAGHTGFISKSGNEWTYLNSGRMDNNLRESSLKKAVGEEPLKLEIENWLNRAARKNESLSITLGMLDYQKLAAFQKGKQRLSVKV